MIPEIQNIFLSFKSANEILTDEFLKTLEQKNDGSTTSIDEQAQMTVEINKIVGKNNETWTDEKVLLINNTNNQPFDDLLGKKAVHKATIYRLIQYILDEKTRPRINPRGTTSYFANVGGAGAGAVTRSKTRTTATDAATAAAPPPPQTPLSYSDMYNKLWKFMGHSDCNAVLRSIIDDKKGKKQTSDNFENFAKISDIVNKFKWSNTQTNSLFETLYAHLSKCHTYTEKNERIQINEISTKLSERTANKKSQKYRFMLNWVILIAFHLYYIDNSYVSYTADSTSSLTGDSKREQIKEDCRELLKHLYKTYVGWMEKMDYSTLKTTFNHQSSKDGATYETKVKEYFGAEINGDATLTPLVNGIQDFLCDVKRILPSRTGGDSPRASGTPRTPLPPSLEQAPDEGEISPEERNKIEERILTNERRKQQEELQLKRKAALEERKKQLEVKPIEKVQQEKAYRQEEEIRKLRTDNILPQSPRGRFHPDYNPIQNKQDLRHAEYHRDALKRQEKKLLAKQNKSMREGLGGGNKQRTRKRQRIARAHHNTKRRLSSNSKPANHKHTRKARQVRASGSV
jgi:hypothetical protein